MFRFIFMRHALYNASIKQTFLGIFLSPAPFVCLENSIRNQLFI